MSIHSLLDGRLQLHHFYDIYILGFGGTLQFNTRETLQIDYCNHDAIEFYMKLPLYFQGHTIILCLIQHKKVILNITLQLVCFCYI